MTAAFEVMLGRLLSYYFREGDRNIEFWELTIREKAIIKTQENLDELIAWAKRKVDNDQTAC